MEKPYRFLPYFFAAFTVLVIYCFNQSYFSHIPDFKDVISPIGNVPIVITNVTHFHAIMIIIWLLMLIVQPILIVKKQIKWHRLLGKVSYLIMALLVISILLVIYQEQTREKNLMVLGANILDLPCFLVMYLFAIYFRKNSAYHARFMVMSVITLLDPALARLNLPGAYFGMAMWVLLFVIEFFNRKTFKPYLIGLSYYVFNLSIFVYLSMVNQPLLDRIWQFFFKN